MGESERSKPAFGKLVSSFLIGSIGVVLIASNWSSGLSHKTSPANACINILRQIDAAKNQWALEHNEKSDDVVTIDDIKPYIEREIYDRYIKLDPNGNLPRCPSGGIYKIGKIGEPPTCSLGTNVTPAHVLH